MTSNQIAYQNYLETVRANQAREQELNRSNVANEGIKMDTLKESVRHNRKGEAQKSVDQIIAGATAAGKAIGGLGKIVSLFL